MTTTPGGDGGPTCFIAMPITTQPEDVDRYGGDADHWLHVMQSLFEKAVLAAGFQPIRPVAQGSSLIHGMIIRQLSTADLVLVDLSGHNPNVFFELGVRTSLNLPIALVRDEHTSPPFDTSGINTYMYDSNLRGWHIEEQQASLARHLRDSATSCAGENPLWRQFGLTIKAHEPDLNESPLEAKLDLLADRLSSLQARISDNQERRAGGRPFFTDDEYDRIANESWTESQLGQPGSPRRMNLFASAATRLARDRFGMDLDLTESGVATLEVGESATDADLRRLADLSKRYDFPVLIRRKGNRPQRQGSAE